MRVSTHLSNIEGMEMAGKLPEVRLANTPFKVVSPFEPSGDQPEAIAALAKGVEEGLRYQTLLGVTGSGKTFTMAKDHRGGAEAHARHGAEQDAGGPAGRRAEGVLPG